MARIIPISKYKKRTPLSSQMIETLTAAYRKQSRHKSFGQNDLDGSFMALLKRELIGSKTITANGEQVVEWYVTDSGIGTLTKLGVIKNEQ